MLTGETGHRLWRGKVDLVDPLISFGGQPCVLANVASNKASEEPVTSRNFVGVNHVTEKGPD